MLVTDDALLQTLRSTWGFDAFRPGQREVIAPLVEGHSAAAVFPTGGGKSLCYQLPALHLDGLTLVVSPLIALMKDQIDALARRGVKASRLDSSLDRDAFLDVMAGVRDGSCRLLYVAPERFNNERFRRSMSGVKIALFAVDEAHCISEWGHNFRPDYLKLVRYAEELGAERVLALTATATPAVLADIRRQFDIAEEHAVVRPFHRPNLALRVEAVGADEREDRLVERLRGEGGSTIVYVTQQATAERVAARLAAEGMRAIAYHAGMKPEQRASLQEQFMGGEATVVVATIAFGMGVDKADIRRIVHFNLPKSLEGYSQEIGRAGRDGEPARCETLACADDARLLESFAYGDTPSEAAVERLLAAIYEDASVGERVELSYAGLANTSDVRLLVGRTLLTYLELDGYLQAETPFYQSFRFKPQASSKEILAAYEGTRQAFVRQVLTFSNKKRTWIHLDVEEAAMGLQVGRGEVVGVLEGLHERGFINLESSGMRFPYRVLRLPEEGLAAELHGRTVERERRELGRLRQVFELLAAGRCLTARLADHFGTPIDGPCGHCSACEGGTLPEGALDYGRELPATLDLASVVAQARALGAGLDEPRAAARFLVGVPSPFTRRAKLTRHPLYGSLTQAPFAPLLEAIADLHPAAQR